MSLQDQRSAELDAAVKRRYAELLKDGTVTYSASMTEKAGRYTAEVRFFSGGWTGPSLWEYFQRSGSRPVAGWSMIHDWED